MASKNPGSKKAKARKSTAKKAAAQPSPQRRRISQARIPARSFREALTVAQAITDNFAGDPTSPHQIAMALDVSPTSSSLAGTFWRFRRIRPYKRGLQRKQDQSDGSWPSLYRTHR